MKSLGIALKQSSQPEQDNDNQSEFTSAGDPVVSRDTEPIKDIADNPTIDLDMNIWKFSSGVFKTKSKFVIDFGIKSKFKYDRLKIYIPFELCKVQEWEDLGERICNNNDLLCAIFNEDYSAIKENNGCFYRIESSNVTGGNATHFRFYVLGKSNVEIKEAVFDEKGDVKGCWISISIVDYDKTWRDKLYYIRFRLHLKEYNQFAIRRDLSNDLIQAAFSKLDLYDLRINENRSLDKKVRETFHVEGYELSSFDKIHVFYIANTKVTIENCNTFKTDSRIIEPKVWETYQPITGTDAVFIAHHWKMKSEQTNKQSEDTKNMRHNKLNLFFTAKYPKIQLWTLIAYLSVIILLGACGSWLSSISVGENTIWENYKIWILACLILYILVWRSLVYRIKVILSKHER